MTAKASSHNNAAESADRHRPAAPAHAPAHLARTVAGGAIVNALSFDVEDYFQVEGFASVIERSHWETYATRVVANTQRVLRLLEAHGVRATFFMLGWIAERHPELVQEIVAGGHELGSHGYWHRPIYQQTPEEFTADVRHSLDVLAGICPGVAVTGYRAPTFSITSRSQWALHVLADLGIKYDSSIFPLSAHDRYGIPHASRFAGRVHPRLCEFPVSTVRYAGVNWPVAGGGYFRLLPYWVTRRAISRIHGEKNPAVIYLHSWEFDPDQPRIFHAPLLSRFRHYVNLHKTEDRMRMLLTHFHFAPLREVFASWLSEGL